MIIGALASTDSNIGKNDVSTKIIELFNQKWRTGVNAMHSTGMNCLAIAKFIKENEGQLNADQVGECLSDDVGIIQAYLELMYFENDDFDTALRKLMTDFKFPGEAQKIDRVMQAFGNEYFRINKDKPNFPFKDGDAVYTLSFSCVMLNTDSFNEAIVKKMSLEQFIRNNRGMNQGENFDPQFLTAVYKRITRIEIKKNAKALTDFEMWRKGQGEYRPGFLTNHIVIKPLKSLISGDVPKAVNGPNFDSWARGEGTPLKASYLVNYYLQGRKPQAKPQAVQNPVAPTVDDSQRSVITR